MHLSLLDAMANRIQCNYLSDLKYIDDFQRTCLVRMLKQVEPEAAALCEWNEALDYLAKEPQQQTQAAAKERLLLLLETPRAEVQSR